jgi:hypothetical protein
VEASVLICDYAQVHQGKLYVTGAAVNLIATDSVEAPHPIDIHAAVMISVPWRAHNQTHRLVIGLIDEDGVTVPLGVSPPDAPAETRGKVVAQFNVGKPAIMQHGDESLFALAIPLRTQLPALGGYRLNVEIDGTVIGTARFRVMHNAQVQTPAQ